MLEPKTFKFQGRSKKLRGLEKCGRERSMSRRSLLRILAGVAATPYVGIETGRDFSSASLLRLTASSAEARTEVTLGGSAVGEFGLWSPQPLKAFAWRSDAYVGVAAASAVIVHLSRQ